jgi:hypothetical protein
MRKYAIPLVLILMGSPVFAQHHATARFSVSPGVGSSSHARRPHAFYLGAPFWMDGYYPPPSPSVVVVQSPPPAQPVQPEAPKTSSPLLIEWQGDRYVRRTSAGAASARSTQPDYIAEAKSQALEKISKRMPARTEMPPTTFIFRDGHREQSSDYSIISGVIYARGDYWTSGSWSQRIPIAQLDVQATQRANQERGVPFRLPSAPNEVVTRP